MTAVKRSRSVSWSVLLGTIAFLAGMNVSHALAITADEVSRQLNKFVDAKDTGAFRQYASDHECILNSALGWKLRRYILNRYTASGEDLKKAENHIGLLLQQTNGISPTNRQFAQNVLTRWSETDYDRFERAFNLRVIGSRAETPNALDSLRKSTRLFNQIDCVGDVAENEYTIGEGLYHSDLPGALTHFRKAEKLAAELGDAELRCKIHLSLAATLGSLPGQFSNAMLEAEHARKIISECHLDHRWFYYFHLIGSVYFYLQDYRSAAARFRAADSVAVVMKMAAKNRLTPLRNLGLCCQYLKQLGVADSAFSIGLCLAQDVHDTSEISWIDVYQADTKISTRDTIGLRVQLLEAREYFTRPGRAKEKQGEAIANYQLGRLESLAGECGDAIVSLRTALEGFTDTKDRVYALKEIGLSYLAGQQSDSALSYLLACSELLDSVRGTVPRADLRRNYLRDKDDVVFGLITALLQKKDTLRALDVAEAHRARSFCEAVDERRSHDDLPRSYFAKRRLLRGRLASCLREIRTCSIPESQTDRLEDRMNSTQDSMLDLYLTESVMKPARSRIQPSRHDWLLGSTGSGEMSLYYYVLRDSMLVWYSDGLSIKFQCLSDSFPNLRKDIELSLKLLCQRPTTTADLGRIQRVLEKLECLIPSAVRERLAGLKGLRIYPTDLLSYLPFDAIRVGGRYLAEWLPIEYSPSLSTSEFLSRNVRPGGSIKSVAIFGGSRYRQATQCPVPLAELPRSFADLSDLPGAEVEVNAIRKVFESGVATCIDTGIQKRVLDKPGMQRADILHIVAHGIVHDDNPNFTGLVLPLSPDPSDDGVLFCDDVSSLSLHSRVVVLSACESGLGSYINGEGILGLSRSFMMAGARSLVVSLWPIDDASSGFFFDYFYQAIREGQSTAGALRVARTRMISETPYKHPYFWAPLVAQGDWR